MSDIITSQVHKANLTKPNLVCQEFWVSNDFQWTHSVKSLECQREEGTVWLKGTEAERVIISPCPEEHLGPEDTDEKRSFKEQRVKCLYLSRNRRWLGQVGAHGWEGEIVNLEKLGGSVIRITRRWEQKPSFRRNLGVPVRFREMEENSFQVSNLHINKQRRHWGCNFFCLCPAARQKLYQG